MEFEHLRKLKEVDKSILHPKKLAILALLYLLGPQPMSNLVKVLELSWAEVEMYVKRLKEDGLVEVKRRIVGDRVRVVISLTKEGEKRFYELASVLEQLVKSVRSGKNAES